MFAMLLRMFYATFSSQSVLEQEDERNFSNSIRSSVEANSTAALVYSLRMYYDT
jgi:hypothetical protein